MKLKPNTTYRDGFGRIVQIMGPARRDDGIEAFWSLGGDHYTPDGRRIGLTGPLRETAMLNLMSEATPAEEGSAEK